jgi:hypothetical protein
MDVLSSQKLGDAVRDAFKDLEEYRAKSTQFIRLYAGKEYAMNDLELESPVNSMELAATIYSYKLSSGIPKAMVTTEYTKLRPVAETLRMALDYLCDGIHLHDTIEEIVLDALFGFGIVKVGINSARNLKGFSEEGGQPFAERVSQDDFVFDTTAESWRKCQFVGNRFSVDAEAARKSKLYRNLDKIDVAGYGNILRSGDRQASDLSADRSSKDASRYRDRYVFWEIWLPYERKIVTMDESLEYVLKEQDWTGPDDGPYIILRFGKVPGNISPLAPAAVWADMHMFIQRVWRKICNQADRQKTITAYAGGTEEDAKRVRDSSDGEIIHVQDIRNVQEVRYGGPDAQMLALATGLDPVFSRIAGNLDVAGGLSPMGETATQDAILNQNSGARFEKMSDSVANFIGQIMRHLAWWMWTDPYIKLPLVKRIGKTVELDVTFDERKKAGDFMDYTIRVSPYSMTRKTPQQTIQALTQTLQMLFQPYAELAMQQGVELDMRELFRYVARCLDIPELNGMLSYGDPVVQPPDGEGVEIEKPPTHSIYERVSRPATNYNNERTALSRAFAGENLQARERNLIGRTS